MGSKKSGQSKKTPRGKVVPIDNGAPQQRSEPDPFDRKLVAFTVSDAELLTLLRHVGEDGPLPTGTAAREVVRIVTQALRHRRVPAVENPFSARSIDEMLAAQANYVRENRDEFDELMREGRRGELAERNLKLRDAVNLSITMSGAEHRYLQDPGGTLLELIELFERVHELRVRANKGSAFDLAHDLGILIEKPTRQRDLEMRQAFVHLVVAPGSLRDAAQGMNLILPRFAERVAPALEGERDDGLDTEIARRVDALCMVAAYYDLRPNALRRRLEDLNRDLGHDPDGPALEGAARRIAESFASAVVGEFRSRELRRDEGFIEGAKLRREAERLAEAHAEEVLRPDVEVPSARTLKKYARRK